MSKSTTASQIAALTALVESQQAQIAALMVAAKSPSSPALEPSDFRIVIVRDIKPTDDKKRRYSQIEVYDNRTGERLIDALIDNERGYGKRSDEGDQTVIYASRRKRPARTAKEAPATTAPATPASDF